MVINMDIWWCYGGFVVSCFGFVVSGGGFQYEFGFVVGLVVGFAMVVGLIFGFGLWIWL